MGTILGDVGRAPGILVIDRQLKHCAVVRGPHWWVLVMLWQPSAMGSGLALWDLAHKDSWMGENRVNHHNKRRRLKELGQKQIDLEKETTDIHHSCVFGFRLLSTDDGVNLFYFFIVCLSVFLDQKCEMIKSIPGKTFLFICLVLHLLVCLFSFHSCHVDQQKGIFHVEFHLFTKPSQQVFGCWNLIDLFPPL